MKDVLASGNWLTNGDLIADVARLGYLKGHVLDCTYGKGRFWTKFQPRTLVMHDIALDNVDFRKLPEVDEKFDSVVIDPPYRLNGTPDRDDFDNRYGVQEYTTWQDRHSLIREGITECIRVLKVNGFLLIKCQDQVCSGAVRWQTRIFTEHAESHGVRLVDRFDFKTGNRPQPAGRKQVHARRNTSTLLVLRKKS